MARQRGTHRHSWRQTSEVDTDQCRAGEEGPLPAARAQCHPEFSTRCLPGATPGGEDLKLKAVSDGLLWRDLLMAPGQTGTAGALAATSGWEPVCPGDPEPCCLRSASWPGIARYPAGTSKPNLGYTIHDGARRPCEEGSSSPAYRSHRGHLPSYPLPPHPQPLGGWSLDRYQHLSQNS